MKSNMLLTMAHTLAVLHLRTGCYTFEILHISGCFQYIFKYKNGTPLKKVCILEIKQARVYYYFVHSFSSHKEF